MSNICEVYLRIEGSQDDLVTFKRLIETNDASIEGHVPYFNIDQSNVYCVFDMTLFDGYLSIVACAPWNPDQPGIQALSKNLHSLLFKVHYSEPGCQLFGTFQIEDGCILEEEELSELDYLSRYNDEFRKEKERIETISYDEFITEYSKEEVYVQHPDCLLEILIINRIKDDDLPLFINSKWMDKEAEKEYKRRFTGDIQCSN